MLSSLKKMRGDKKGWYKVSDLRPGLEIAVPGDVSQTQPQHLHWDEIVSIKPVGRERVYDIEVENTHNFVGNDIFAHNTYVLKSNTMLEVTGEVNAGNFIVPVGSAAGATSTSALGREIPTEVLTADGKGVDLYKLATFTLSGVQALAAKVDAAEVRLTSLEDRMNALESGAITSASGSPLALSTTSLASALESFGVLIGKGFAQFVKIAADNLQVGSPEHPTGITMYDKTTGEPYCFEISNGAPATTPGECAAAVAPAAPVAGSGGGSTSASGTPPPATTSTDTTVTTTTTLATTTATYSDTTTATTTATITTASADTTPPVVTLNGAAALQINVGDTFTDPSATALDNVDGDSTTHIIVSGRVDSATAGLYTLTYSATDTAGNSSSVSRVVTVIAPTISP